MIPGSDRDHPSFVKSFGFAIQGFRTTWQLERNIKVMVLIGVVAVVLGFVLQISIESWAIIILTIGAVIAGELLNTAVETVVDLVSPEYHPLAGKAKDVAAAAVWVLSVAAGVIAVLIFGQALLARLGFWG